MSYVKSGEFTLRTKLRWALIDNLKYYAILSIVGLCFLLYLWWNNAFANLTLRGFLIALSNAWGLFQIIIFLGYGTVAVPKHCLK
jgi:hypothetical protein